MPKKPTPKKVAVRREKTAIKRYSCSRPIAVAVADSIITAETSVFDYGCGHGADIKFLGAKGISVAGWDPHFAPKEKVTPADIVNLGYVLNVIEDPVERDKALRKCRHRSG